MKKSVALSDKTLLSTRNILLGIFLFTFILYANTLGNGYNMDDDLVTNKHKLTSQGISAIPEIFSSTYYYDEMGYAYDYRPVVLSSFAIEHELFGENPKISHLINIVLYSISNILLFIVLTNLFSNASRVFILCVTLLFIAHPLHTEVVASIKNRDELLSFLFGLLSSLAFLKWYTKTPFFSYFFGFIFFALGILSKPGIAPFALIIPLSMVIFRINKTSKVLLISFSLWTIAFLFSPLMFPLQYLLFFILLVVFPVIFTVKLERIFFLFSFFLKKIKSIQSSGIQIRDFLLKKIKAVIHFRIQIKDFFLKKARSIVSSVFLIKEYLFKKQQSSRETEIKETDFYTFSNIPIVFFILFFLLSTIIVCIGIYTENYLFSISGLLLLSLNYLLINKKVRQIYIYSYITALLAISLKYDLIFSQSAIAVFAFFILSEIYTFRAVTCLLLTLPLLIVGYFSDSDLLPSVVFLVMKALESSNKKSNSSYRIGLIILLLILIGSFALELLTKDLFQIIFIVVDAFTLFVLTLILLLRAVSPLRKLIIPIFSTLVLILFNLEYFIVSPSSNISSYTQKIEKIEEPSSTSRWITPILVETKNIYNDGIAQTKETYNNITKTPGLRDQILKQKDRPLIFIEYPFEINGSKVEKASISAYVLGEYLKLLIIPYPMRYYYGYAQVEAIEGMNAQSLVPLIIHILLFIIALVIIRKHTILSFGIIYYLICISVYSNFFYPLAGVMADRFTYIASLGFCISVIFIFFKIFKIEISRTLNPKFKPVFLLLMFLILGTYSYQTIARNTDWKDQLTLFRNDIKHLEKSAQANYLLATRLVFESFENKSSTKQNKMRKEALNYYQKALEIYPPFFNAQYNLARTYSLLEDQNNALNEFKKTIELDSSFFDPYFQVAVIYEQQGQINEAISYYEQILSRFSQEIQAYNNLSLIYFRQKNYEKSMQINQIAIQKIPKAYDPLLNIARIYSAMGEKTNALIYFEKAYNVNTSDIQLVMILSELSNELGQREKYEFYQSRVKKMRNGN